MLQRQGTMVLKAQNKVEGFETVEVPLKDIHILVDPNSPHHGVKYKACAESLEKGMRWPIILSTYETYWKKEKLWPKHTKEGYGVTNGNKRVLWAIDNDYKMIDSIIVKSKKERDEVNKSTYIFFEEYP